jgi:hypothetical protein
VGTALTRLCPPYRLKMIIVSHGEPITDDPAGVLRRLADGLDL